MESVGKKQTEPEKDVPIAPEPEGSFQKLTRNIYEVVAKNGGRVRMSEIAAQYRSMFGEELDFDGNPKFFVKMERLLLLNCERKDDVVIFFTPEPAYKLVVRILKRSAHAASGGLPVSEFRRQLEERMGMTLQGCDFADFMQRWRFLSLRDGPRGEQTVLFTPHSGTTVFFGNIHVVCTEEDIYRDLAKADPNWKHANVRLKLGKGHSYAFVDFPTRADALRAVRHFDDRAAFKSSNVSADIEAVDQRKRGGLGNSLSGHNHASRAARASSRGANGGSVSRRKATVYLGQLRDNVTKQEIQDALAAVNAEWVRFPIRLNLRSGWSHAFVDFESLSQAKRLIAAWHGKTHALSAERLRCEISKRTM